MKPEALWKIIGGSGTVILILVAGNVWWAQRFIEKQDDTREIVIKLSSQVGTLLSVSSEVSNIKERVSVLETRVQQLDRRSAARARRAEKTLATIKAQTAFMRNYWIVHNP